LQKAFITLKNLDRNNNSEIELAEVESLKPQAPADRRGRMLAGLKQVDKNGNHKIDDDEVEGLQKMIAGGRMMTRLDRNGNGKLEPEELERLNQHLEQGLGRQRGATSTPSLRKAPAKPAETPPAKEEKKDTRTEPVPEAKPPGNFGT
jgi:hypothetical protein